MKHISRLQWRLCAIVLCVPWCSGAASAQRASRPESASAASQRVTFDPFATLLRRTSTVPFDAASGNAMASTSRGYSALTPGRTPSKLDFNKDTKSDLLFQNTGTGQLAYWLMDGDRLLNYGYLNPSNPGSNWIVVASADFNGDGKTDLVLQATDTGDLIYWLLDGPNQIEVQFITPKNPGQNWNVVGAADMNHDGRPDLIFQNSLTNDIYVWYMQGTTLIAGAYINPRNPGTGWKIAAVGDLNGDGNPDIVFQKKLFVPADSPGNVYVWYMQNDIQIGGGFLAPANPGAAWNVAGLVDFLGQGRPQIVFQNAGTGELAYWVMDGLNLVRFDVTKPNSPGASWKLVGSK